MAEVILENHYGSHQPAVFCEKYISNLTEQGLGDEAQVILEADRAVSVLYDDPHSPELDGVDVASLTEQATCAWETILEAFIPEPGYRLGYLPDDQALFMLPASDETEEEADWIIEGKDDYVEFEAALLHFEPSERKNLLGHAAEWGAKLEDWQVEALASIADEYGEGLKVEWGCFMCPAKLWANDKLLVVDTSGTW